MSSVSDRLRLAREKSKKRKELLKFTLGSGWVEELGGEVKRNKNNEEKTQIKYEAVFSDQKPITTHQKCERNERKASNDGKEKQIEEFRDSTAFLKGTQSLNPHNDYSQNFVDTGQRPQNFISNLSKFDYYL